MMNDVHSVVAPSQTGREGWNRQRCRFEVPSVKTLNLRILKAIFGLGISMQKYPSCPHAECWLITHPRSKTCSRRRALPEPAAARGSERFCEGKVAKIETRRRFTQAMSAARFPHSRPPAQLTANLQRLKRRVACCARDLIARNALRTRFPSRIGLSLLPNSPEKDLQ